MGEKEIRERLKTKLKEREAIVSGKARITEEEEKAYNRLGQEILGLRRNLYPKKETENGHTK